MRHRFFLGDLRQSASESRPNMAKSACVGEYILLIFEPAMWPAIRTSVFVPDKLSVSTGSRESIKGGSIAPETRVIKAAMRQMWFDKMNVTTDQRLN